MSTVTLKFDKSSFKREKPRKSKEEWREEQKANEIKLFCKLFKENQYLLALEEVIGGKAHLGGAA